MKTTKLQQLKSIAKKRKDLHKKGRKRLITDEQLDLVRKMRMSGHNLTETFMAMKEAKMMPYKTYACFVQAYKNR